MITKVCPVANSNGATANTAIEVMLNGLKMKVPPKDNRLQTSNPMISAARNSHALRSAMR